MGEAQKQERKAVPRFKFRGPNREEKCIDALVWGDINLRFHSYVVAVLQALWKLHQLYTINEYGTYLVSNNVETTNNNVWNNCVQCHITQIIHKCWTHLSKMFFLTPSSKFGKKPIESPRNTELTPPSKQVLCKSYHKSALCNLAL